MLFLIRTSYIALPDKGPPVHLELRELVGREDDGLVEELGHPEVDGEPGGVVGSALEAQPGTGGGRRHPARLQLGEAGEVSAREREVRFDNYKLIL